MFETKSDFFSTNNKNFKEDEKSNCQKPYKMSGTDLFDIKSEISEGKRIDLDEDTNVVNNSYLLTKSKIIIIINFSKKRSNKQNIFL